MSVQKPLLLTVACLGLSAVIPAKLHPESTYPLVCRGGGDMSFSLHASQTVTRVNINFRQGTRGVGSNWQLLSPGECSWTDRAVHPQEPSVILHDVPVTVPPNHIFMGVSWNASRTVGFGPDLLSRHPYLEGLTSPNGAEVFQVYNNRQGYFVVTRLGY